VGLSAAAGITLQHGALSRGDGPGAPAAASRGPVATPNTDIPSESGGELTQGEAPKADAVPKRAVLVVSAAPGKVPQGSLLCVAIDGVPSTPEVTVKVFGQKLRAFSIGPSSRVFVPVGVNQPPGVYMVDATCADAGVIPAFFTVLPTEFPSSRITVTRETAQLTQDQARIQRDQALVRKAKSSTHSKPHWAEPFSLPLEAPVSTPFGHTRYVNGRESGRHWGIDFAADAGTPVRASNSGRVVVAATLHLSGNTVVIDHGLNLFTSYLHMRDIVVKEGGLVDKGAVIGHVGSTGFSTGPHLHWSATCGSNSFDPSALLSITY